MLSKPTARAADNIPHREAITESDLKAEPVLIPSISLPCSTRHLSLFKPATVTTYTAIANIINPPIIKGILEGLIASNLRKNGIKAPEIEPYYNNSIS